MRGIERRIDAGLNAHVPSVASVFISRWDKATFGKTPVTFNNTLGIAVATHVYRAYQNVLLSDRMQRLMNFGARPQRLLWGSTGTKDPTAPETLYVEALAAPNTINTMPEATLTAFADHGKVDGSLMQEMRHAEEVISLFATCGFAYHELAERLQHEGVEDFVTSWNSLMDVIRKRCAAIGNRTPV